MPKNWHSFFLFPSQEDEGKEKNHPVRSQAIPSSSDSEILASRLPASLAKACQIEQAAVEHKDAFNPSLPTNSVEEPYF
jgi:hypothetical protein